MSIATILGGYLERGKKKRNDGSLSQQTLEAAENPFYYCNMTYKYKKDLCAKERLCSKSKNEFNHVCSR